MIICSLIGALNKLPLAVVGMMFFDDPITIGGTLAVMLGLMSGLVYTWAKNQQRMEKARKPRAMSLSNIESKAEGSNTSNGIPGVIREEVYGQSGSIVSHVRRI